MSSEDNHGYVEFDSLATTEVYLIVVISGFGSTHSEADRVFSKSERCAGAKGALAANLSPFTKDPVSLRMRPPKTRYNQNQLYSSYRQPV